MAFAVQAALTVVLGSWVGHRPCQGVDVHVMEPWTYASLVDSDWVSRTPLDGGVPAPLFARAMTSLPPHYRGDLEALGTHLQEEHRVFSAEAPNVPRAHLCCSDYNHGPNFKSLLTEVAARDGGGVRTALNHPRGYCAIAHLSSATAITIPSEVHQGARCSPLTHASKEPVSLVAPASVALGTGNADSAAVFGLKLGASLQGGPDRSLVVTMSPGSLPMNKDNVPVRAKTRGGAERKLETVDGAAQSSSKSATSAELKERWKAAWNGARGRPGAQLFSESVSWTSSSRRGGSDRGARRLGGEGDSLNFHGAKVKGYKAALLHLSGKMELTQGGEESGRSLSEACGWDKMTFVHGRSDVLYLREIYDASHDEETEAACFLMLVGFLSSQPDVMHIHPEAKVEATNKILTAYVEGGGATETPMRVLGLNGTGQVIGVADTGLDDNSCFFRDDNGMVPRTSISDADFYPDQRKVTQYVEYADGLDEDGHGTHVAGIAAGAIYSGWKDPWEVQVSEERCEDAGLIRSCFGDCVSETVGGSCRWNPELSCPMSDCDEDVTCDDQTGYPTPCFEDPEVELPAAAGMAPGSKLSFFDIGLPDGSLVLPNDIGDMFDSQHMAGARIFSNSWSLVTQNEPTDRDIQLDEWVHDNPDSLVVFGAGNKGFTDGQFHSRSVQSPATSKTATTVGCSNSGPDRAYAYYNDATSGYEGVMSPGEDIDFEVSPFSARGPVGEFTLKPDVVAPGLMVHSAKASKSEFQEETCALESYGGTSMAAPAIAGAAALVRQYFAQGMFATYLDEEDLCDEGPYSVLGNCDAFEPAGYLVKAILINSAVWLGNMQTLSYDGAYEWMTILDFAQGFGAVQLASGLPTSESQMGGFFHDYSLKSNKRYYYLIFVQDPEVDLSATVAWYDPPSTVSSYNLLHDLDTFVYSMNTEEYYRSNSFNTLVAMCGTDEDCVNKYDFSFANSLADDLNPVERIVVPSDDLEEGYYVVCVRARVLTESDSQSYGLAVTGAGLLLHDVASSWSNLGAETQAATGGWDGNTAEPDPDNEFNTPSSAPTGSPLSGSSTQGEDTEMPTPSTPAPTHSSFAGAEQATSSESSPEDTDDSSSVTNDDTSSSTSEAGDGGRSGAGTSSTVAYPAVGGDVDSGDPGDIGSGGSGDSDGDVVGRDSDSSAQMTVVIATSVAGAAALIAILTCITLRHRKGRGTGASSPSDMCTHSFIARGAAAARISDGDSVITVDEGHTNARLDDLPSAYGQEHYLDSPGMRLPGYDTAVLMPRDDDTLENTHMVRSAPPEDYTSGGGVGEDELDATNLPSTTEASVFYAAVDPSAVSKLAGWGISRDFARVALRQTGNDIPAALRMVAKGDMDTRLALDLEEMARQASSEAVKAVVEAELAAEAAETVAQAH